MDNDTLQIAVVICSDFKTLYVGHDEVLKQSYYVATVFKTKCYIVVHII